MKSRRVRKRIVSLMLALVLCVSTWAGDFQMVMAAEDGLADQNSPVQMQEIENEGDNEEAKEDKSGGDENGGDDGGEDEGDGTEDGTEEDETDGDDENDDGDEDGTEGDETDEDDGTEEDEEKAALTDEDIETISEAICDALYDEIEERFCEEWQELYDSLAEEYGPDDEDNGESAEKLYTQLYTAQFHTEFYKQSCALLVKVLTEQLDIAKEQEAYADLQNEAVYNKVYDSIYNKLYEEYVAGLDDVDVSSYAVMTNGVDGRDTDRSNPVDLVEEGIFEDQIEIDNANTWVKVTIDGVETTYQPEAPIDLSKVDSNKTISFSMQTAYKVKYGQYNDEHEADGSEENRDLIGGDFFTVSGIPAALEITPINPTTLTASIDGSNVDMVNVEGPNKGSDEKSSITYTFTDNVDKNNETLYLGIAFKAGLQFTLNKEELKNSDTTEFELGIPGNTHVITLPKKASTLPDSISKSGHYNDDHTITWTIDIGPDARSLAGFTVEDVLDTTYQELVSVSWAGTTLYEYDCDKGEEKVKNGDITINDSRSEISYTFGDTASTSDGKFIVKTRLNDQAEYELLAGAKNGSAATLKPKNSAFLTPPTGTAATINNEAENKEVTVTGTANPVIEKAYEQISADVIRWTITVNPDKNRIWKAVVTDELAYLPVKLSLIEGTVKINGAPIGKDDTSQSTYYTYDAKGDNAEDVLAVTFQNAFLANKTCKLTFDTQIKTNASYDGNHITKIKNKATIVCSFPDGSGFGSGEAWESGTIECPASEHMLSKEFVSFDKQTGLITWRLKPSCGSTAFEHAVITDYVGETSNESGSRSEKGNQQSLHEKTADVQVMVGGKNAEEGSYRCEIDEDNKTLTIVFSGENDTSCSTGHSVNLSSVDLNKVSITYKTHAEDWGVSAVNGAATAQRYYNTASLQVDGAKTIYANADTGVQEDNMITKSADSYYADGNSGFRYTIKVNNDRVKLADNEGAVLVDDLSKLETNLKYQKISSTNTYVDVTPAADEKAQLVLDKVMLSVDSEAAIPITIDSSNYTGTEDALGKLTLDLSEYVSQGQQVTVTLDVKIKNSQELFMEGYVVYGTNTASVTTKTPEGATGTFTASVGAQGEGQIKNKRVEKSYWADQANRAITYTIKVNPWAADMGTVKLQDILTDENVEYDDESFQLYEGINNGQGSLSKGAEVTSGWRVSFVNNADGSKEADVIIDSCTEPYVLEYKVMVLDGATSPVVNNVELYSRGNELDSSTCSADISSWGTATGGTVDKITVKKLYKDPVTGQDTPLAGATFGLIKKNADNPPSKTVVSNENGEAVFKGLALNTDYWIKELEAPEGYEAVSGDAHKIHTRTSEQVANKTNIESVTWKCYNTRSTGEIEFTKVDDSAEHNGLGGAGFLLYYEEAGTTKLVKTECVEDGTYKFVELVSKNADLDTDKEAAGGLISSASAGTVGNVKVTGIPWGDGTYYFVEAQGPNGYMVDTTKQYKFTVRKADGQEKPEIEYDTKSSHGNFVTDTINSDTRYTILNSKYQFELIKQDQNEKPVEGVKFGLYKDASCIELLNFSGESGSTNPFWTDEYGRVTIKDNSIRNDTTYYLKEISAPAEFGVSTEVVSFQIDSRTKNLVVTDRTPNQNGVVTLTDYTINTKQKIFTVTDQALLASVELFKKDSVTGEGIKGVAFDLYKLADKDVAAQELGDETRAVRIIQNLVTDEEGCWRSSEDSTGYTDSVGNSRTVSDGLTGGWYCFKETAVPDNVIMSTELYKFCIKQDVTEDGKKITVVTDEQDGTLPSGGIDLSKDARFEILNSRIKAYLRKEGVDKEGNNKGLLTDAKDELTLTLYEKQNDGTWSDGIDFKPDNVSVTDGSLGTYDGYSNDISQYLKTGKEYKIVETKPHSSLTYMKADDYYFAVDASGDLYPMTLQEDGSFKTAESKLDQAVIVMTDVEATMSIQNHYTHEGIFVCNLTDSQGKKIVANQTLIKSNEGSAHDITVGGIDGTSGGATASLYMLQRGVKYTLTSTYYLTEDDYQKKRNSYQTTTVVTCNEYGRLVMADGRELTDNTFHIYGATQIVVKKVAADGVLKDREIPGAKLMLMKDGKQAPQVEFNGKSVTWSWTTDGYKPVEDGKDTVGDKIEGTDGKTYVYEDPDGNLNQRAGYVAGFSGATVFTLRETKAPSGYKRAADIKFSLDDGGNIEILSGAEDGQITYDSAAGIVTITMKDEEGSDYTSGHGSSHKSSHDVEAVIGTVYSADESSSDTDTASSAVQLLVAEADVNEQDKKEGRNVKTEDKTPIALYLILSVVTLGAFAILTLLLKKKRSK